MSVIDQNIVQMRFDNKQFEDNVADSISTLEKLKGALHFDKISDGFDAVTKAAGKVDLNPISEGIQTVMVKFDALEVAAVAALTNIVNKGVNKLESAVKSMSVDQVTSGWSKYEEKVTSVQTIMNATGKSIEEVSDQLNRLNWYSDETSYSFTDMTSNVGKFTSVGIELEDAVSAMEGIAGWAALAGKNSGEASRAMYNLSQAMGIGYLGSLDWKTIENLNMNTTEFGKIALETAADLGQLTKAADGTFRTLEGNVVTVEGIRDTLKDKWFTKDVMMSVFDVYGAYANELSKVCEETGLRATELIGYVDQYVDGTIDMGKVMDETKMSAEDLYPILERLGAEEYAVGRKALAAGQEAKTLTDALDATKDAVSTQWMSTFELMFGNYEVAKEFFTEVTDYLWDFFATSGDVRNEILGVWADLGGGDYFRSGLLNVLETVDNITSFLREMIFKVLGIWEGAENTTESFAQSLWHFTKRFDEIASKLAESTSDLFSKLRLTDEMYSGLRSLLEGFGNVFSIFWQALSSLKPALSWLLGIFHDIVQYLTENVFKAFGESTKALNDFLRRNHVFESVVTFVTDNVAKAWEKVKKVLQPLTDILNPIINKLNSFFTSDSQYVKLYLALTNIKNRFEDIISSLKQSERFTKGLETIKNNLTFVKDTLTTIIHKIGDFFSGTDFSGILGTIWGYVKDIAGTLWDLVTKIDFGKIVTSVTTAFSNMFSGIRNAFQNFNLQDMFTSLWDGIGNAFSGLGNYDTDNIFKNLTKGVMIFNGFNFGKLLGSVSGGIENLTDNEGGIVGFFKNLISPVTDVFDQLKETIGSFTKNIDQHKLRSIGIAVAILTGALVVLAGVDSDKMNTALEGLAGILGGLFLEMKGLSKIDLSMGKQFKNIGMGMIEIAGACLLIAKAIEPFADMETKQIIKSLGAMTVILGEFLGFIAVFGAISRANQIGNTKSNGIFGLFQKSNGFDKQMKNVAMAMIELGAAMKIFASATKDFGNIDDLVGGIGAITVVMVNMMAFIFVASSVDTKGMTSVAFAMIELGAAMKIFASAMQSFGTIKQEEIIPALGGMITCFGEMLIFILVGSAVADKSGEIAAISGAMVVLGVAFKIFASVMNSLKTEETHIWMNAVAQMVVIFAGMLAFMIVGSLIADKANDILIISAALGVLGVAMKIFASAARDFQSVEWGELAKIAAIIGGFIVALRAIGLLSSILAPVPVILTAIGTALISVGAGLTLIGIGIAAINVGALVANLTEFSKRLIWTGDNVVGLVKKMNIQAGADAFIKVLTSIVSAIPKIVAGIIAGIISSIGDVIASLGDLLEGVKVFVFAFLDFVEDVAPALVDTVLTIVLETLRSITEKAPEILDTIFDLVIKILDKLIEKLPEITAKVAEIFIKIFDNLTDYIPDMLTSFMNFIAEFFGTILDRIANTDQDTLLKIAEMFLGLVAVIEILNLIKSQIPGAMAGLLEIGLFVGELSAIIAALGALDSSPGFHMLVDKGGDLLESVGKAIGKLIGGIIGGIAEGATSTLPQVGTNIADFWKNIEPFIDGVEKLRMETVKKVGYLASAIDALTAADLIGGIADWLRDATGAPEFGVSIAKMWENIKPFVEGVSKLNAGTVMCVGFLSDAILKLTAAQLLDGITSFILGEQDIEKFGTSIGALGPHLANFAESVKDIKTEPVQVAAEAIGILAEAFDRDIFKTGGLFQWVKGETSDLGKFGTELAEFGTYMVGYAESVKDMNVDKVKPASEAIADIAEVFSRDVFKTGGVMQWFKGENGIADFGKALKSLGPNLAFYAQSVKSLAPESIENSAKAILLLAGVAEKLPDKTIVDKWFKVDKMKDFTDSIKLLGGSLKDYYDNIAGIKASQMAAMITATTDLFNLFSGESGVTFKIDKDFKKAMKEIASSGIDEFVSSFAQSVTQVHDAGTEFITTFSEGISESAVTIQETFDNLFSYCMNKFDTAYRDFKKAGIELMKNFASGISQSLNVVKSAGNTILSSILSQFTAQTLKDSFKKAAEDLVKIFSAPFMAESLKVSLKTAGEDLMKNFSTGILSQVVLVAASASVVSAEALAQTNNAVLLQSFTEAGQDVTIAYAKGIYAEEETVKRAAAAIAAAARESITSDLEQLKSDIQSYIDAEIDYNPVITPTIDTSELEATIREYENRLAEIDASASGNTANSVANGFNNGSRISNSETQSYVDDHSNTNTVNNWNFYGMSNYKLSEIYRKLGAAGVNVPLYNG